MKIIATNKKAYFEYFIEETIEAGICLEGSEVKSLREGKCSLSGSYISLDEGEARLKNFEIAKYDNVSSAFVPNIKRERKLLLHKNEIFKLKQKMQVKGYTLVPTKIYFKNNLIKVEIGVAKGKHLYDKKDVLKQKDLGRQMDKDIKNIKLNY